jgi:error-prone DNA polymerase
VGCTVADTPDGPAVRIGLGYVLGVRADEVRAVVEARSAAGPFRSLDELVARSGAGRPALERLAWSGACDALAAGEVGPVSAGQRRPSPRRIALWRLGVATPAQRAGEEGTQLALPLALPEAPALAPLAAWQAMIADYSTTGLTVHAHPLELLRDGLTERGGVSAADLTRLPHGSQVRIGGLVVARQRPGTANGVVFLLLEDETGTVNLIVPPPVYERDRLTVRTEPLVMVQGKLERFASAGGAINLLVRRLTPLDAPELLDRRPRAEVKDFSMLDARELARIQSEAEQPRVAVAAAGGVTAAHVRPAASAGGAAAGHVRPAASAGGAAAAHVRPAASGGRPSAASPPGPGVAGPTAGPEHPADAPDHPPSGPPTDGAEDFRAVAPPIMSFAQGRRR